MFRFVTNVFLTAVLLIPAASAQPPARKPVFETASIKSVEYGGRPDQPGSITGGLGTDSPLSIRYTDVTLHHLLRSAFGVKDEQIVGPASIDTDRYEVTAAIPAGTTVPQFRLMLQNLIADRLKMKFHKGTKEMPVLVITAPKGAGKLQVSKSPTDPGCMITTGIPKPGEALNATTGVDPIKHRACRNMNMQAIMDTLPRLDPKDIDRPLVDQTGLKDNYDFLLEWANANDPGPKMLDALESLGLKLEPRKMPLPTIVIDHIEKVAAR
jgi:uncharacterized protein (TIGR03435 family)